MRLFSAVRESRAITLRARVVVLMLVVAATLAALGVWVLDAAHAVALQRAEEVLRSRAVALAAAVDGKFEQARGVLRMLAVSGSLARGDLARLGQEMETASAAADGATLALVRADGSVVLGPVGAGRRAASPSQSRLLRAERRDLREVAEQRRPGVLDLDDSPLLGAARFGVAWPVVLPPGLAAAGDTRGAFALYFDPGTFNRLLIEQDLGEGIVAAVVDRARRIVARSQAQERYLGALATSGTRDALASDRAAIVHNRTHEGVRAATGVARADGSGFAVAVALLEDQFAQPVRESFVRLLTVSVLVVIAGLALAFAMTERVRRALWRVAENVSPQPTRTGIAEIDTLAERLSRHEAAHRAAEERLRLLAASGDRLAVALDARASLGALLEVVVPALADAAACFVPARAQGEAAVIAVRARQPAQAEDIRMALQAFASRVPADHPLARVLATGEPQRVDRPGSADGLSAGAQQDAARARPGDASLIYVPIAAHGRVYGALCVSSDAAMARAPLDRDTLELVRELGRRAGIAVHNALLMERLAASEERLRLATDEGGLGVWDIDVESGEGWWSRAHFVALGLPVPDDARGSMALWHSRVHPDDRERIVAAAERARVGGTIYRAECRVIRADDGRVVWFDSLGRFHYDEGARARRFVGIMFDTTERHEALERLREADRAKDQFLAMLGHELRNPLAPIHNALRVAADARADSGHRAWALAMIERQTRHLTRLVDDLLDVSRVTQGKINLRRGPVDVEAVVRDAIESVRPLAQRAGQRIALTVADGSLVVFGDATRLAQIVTNLLTNASKYSPADSRIALTLARDGGEAVVTVQDEGEGIDAEFLPRIFELFAQADRALDRAQGGLGIGLALVRTLVDLHGGSVSAASAGRGRGAVFTVRLPLADAATGRAAARDASIAG